MAEPDRAPAAVRGLPSFREALRVWAQVGLNSFGGPAGQIAVMHRMLVEERRWVGEARLLHALNYCMLLPGPEAQQLAIYLGWLLHRTAGGLAAGILFVMPGALVMLALSALYVRYQRVTAVEALFFGLKAAVLAVVVEALLRIGRRALKGSLYSSTKFAATGMAEAARLDFNETGVRVTVIEPGMVETPGFSHDMEETLTADDIARAVLWVVSQPPHVDINEIVVRPTAQNS